MVDTITASNVTAEEPAALPTQATEHPLYQEVESFVNEGNWQAAREPLAELMTLYPDDAYLNEVMTFIHTRSALLDSDYEAIPARRSFLARSMGVIVPAIVVLAIVIWAAVAVLALQLWIVPQANAQRQTEQISQIRQDAQAALSSGDYDRAILAYNEILVLMPGDIEAQDGLAQAGEMRATASLYSEAIALMEAHHWEDALLALNQIEAEQPGYRDISERIVFVQEQQGLSTHFNSAEAAFERGYYELAIQEYEALQSIDSGYQRGTVQDGLFFSYLQLGLAGEAAAGDDRQQLESALIKFEKALVLRPDDAQATGEAQLLRMYLSGLDELEAGNWSQAVSNLTPVYESRPDFAGGTVSVHLYKATLAWGDELYADGQYDQALVQYQGARLIKGADAVAVERRIAVTKGALETPTPTPEPTEIAPTATPAAVNPAPRPTATPRPMPYTLIGMSVKPNCDGVGYIHGIVWSVYDLPMSGVVVQAFNSTTGFGPLVALPTNADGIYQIIIEKDHIEGLWVVQVLENGQPASQTWGQHLGGGCVNGAQELKADWKRVMEIN